MIFLIAFVLFIRTVFIHVDNLQTCNQIQTAELKTLISLHSIHGEIENFETAERAYLQTGNIFFRNKGKESVKLITKKIQTINPPDPNYNQALGKFDSLQHIQQVMAQYLLLPFASKGSTIVEDPAIQSQILNLNKTTAACYSLINILIQSNEKTLNETEIKKENLVESATFAILILTLLIFGSLLVFFYLFNNYIRHKSKVRRESEETSSKILDLYDNAPCGYHSIDKNGWIVEINQTELTWLGYERGEIIGKKKFIELLSAESKNRFEITFPGYIQQNVIKDLEYEMVRENGETFFVQLTATAITDSNGNFLYSRAIIVDISERRKNETKVDYLNSIVEQSSDAIFSTDINMVIKSWNKGAESMYGYKASEVIDQPGTNFLHSVLNKESMDEIISQVCMNGHWQGESQQRKKDGNYINVLSSLTPIHQPNGELTGFVSINQDISTQKLYENQLKQFNKELSQKVIEKTNEIRQNLERMTDGFIAFDKDWRFTMLNEQSEQMLGMKASDLLGKIIWDVFPGVQTHPLFKADIDAMQSQKHVEIEEYFEPLGRWFFKSIYPSPDGITIILKDRTEVRNAEIRQANSERKYKLLFRNNPLPMWMVMWPTTKILDVNEAAIKRYGYTREEFLTMGTIDLLTPSERDRLLKCIDKPMENVRNPGVWKHMKKDGSLIDVEIINNEIVLDDQVALLVLANDVTEKILAEDALIDSNNQLRKLSTHLEKIREEERTFIAREIHDELGQQLTGLKMDISWLTKKMHAVDPELKLKAQEMLLLIDDTVKTVRRIATELRPGILDDLGLIAALQWQSQEFSKRTGILCHFNTDLHDQHYDHNLATGIFRIFQESLTNVARHASAAKVSSSLSLYNNELVLIVEDDGIGFKETEKHQPHSLGLLGMRERAHSLKGALTISSEPGAGTKIQLTTPFVIVS
ncbi:MAG: PAS domain S-box protein [Bacteroidia bacterium]|nr:PAS domain S-box protein [Bacteroidia bacterium]